MIDDNQTNSDNPTNSSADNNNNNNDSQSYEIFPEKPPNNNDISLARPIIPPVKLGWAYKQGHVVFSWKKRFFVLHEGVIKVSVII